MTTPSELSSPFQVQNSGGAPAPTPTNTEEFSFRTMQDDLLAPPKNIPTPPSVPVSPAAPIAPTPIQPREASINAPIKNIEPEKKILEANSNPFLEKITPADNRGIFSTPLPAQTPNPLTVPPKITPIEIPTNNLVAGDLPATRSVAYQSLIFVTITLVVGIIGLGGYYFWMNRAEEQTTATPVVEEIITPVEVLPVEEPVVVMPPVEKYSAEKPNYLMLDMKTIAAGEIQTKISSIATEIKEKSQSSAYEFMVVDANNNPVFFSAFAAAAKLNFSPALLKAMGDKFSLFIYIDGGEIKMGLSTVLSDPAILTIEMQKQEKTLPVDISFMFLGSIPSVTTGTFNNGSYDAYKTRYFNLNSQGTLSIDYAITDTIFALGTSKNTLRSILKKNIPSQTTSGEVPGVTSKISQSTTTNISMADVIDKFKTCQPAMYSDNTYYQYSISGKQNGLCAVTIRGIKDTQFENKEMICLWDNSTKSYEQAMAGIFGDSCTGELKNVVLRDMKSN